MARCQLKVNVIARFNRQNSSYFVEVLLPEQGEGEECEGTPLPEEEPDPFFAGTRTPGRQLKHWTNVFSCTWMKENKILPGEHVLSSLAGSQRN